MLYVNCSWAGSSLSPYLNSVFYMHSNLCMKKKTQKRRITNVIKCDSYTGKCGCWLLWYYMQFIAWWSLFCLLYFIQVESTCLNMMQEMEDLCKLHCLSVVFLLHSPLSQRACARFITSHWAKNIQTFLKMVNMLCISLFIFCFNCLI